MTDGIPRGLPAPPALGAAALPSGTYGGAGGAGDRRRHRAGQGHRRRVRTARRGPGDRGPARRAARGRARGTGGRARRGRGHGRGLRHPGPGAGGRGLRRGRGRGRAAGRAGEQRGRQLPLPGRGPLPGRLAGGGGHHPDRHLVHDPRVRPPPPRRGDAGLDRGRRRLLRLDRRAGLRAQRGGQGRGEEPGGDARRRVGAVRHPDQRARPRAVRARRDDRGHPGRPGARRTGLPGRPAARAAGGGAA